MCGKPTLNGEPGYSWDGKGYSTRSVNPPDLKDGDQLLYDEPGRCGGLDSHSHHIRLVKNRSDYVIRVRHGGGDEAVALSCAMRLAIDGLAALDSNARYWLLLSILSAVRDSQHTAEDKTADKYRKAFVDGRLKKRRLPRSGVVKVWIEPQQSLIP
jgi:hypothetical protein